MIEAVFIFGMINVIFEFVVLSMLPPRVRLRLLGSAQAQLILHIVIMMLILIVHWGTLIGTMSGFFSFILSMGTVWCAQRVYGKVVMGRYYHLGLIRYSPAELV